MINLYKVYVPESLSGAKMEQILRSGQLTGGENVRLLESRIAELTGNPFVVVTGSNMYASLIALALCGLKNNDEVIASPMACLASNQPVLNFGAKLVWADIDPRSGSLDPADVERRITPRTRAILHYHWGGYPGHIDDINAIGRKHGIPVIDDAIESFGAEYRGRILGNCGTDMTTFSFQTVRLPNSVDGGAIVFRERELFETARLMRDFGITRSTFRDRRGEISAASDISLPGYNAVMNELSAYVGNEVLTDTPALIEKQRDIALVWDSYCSANGFIPLKRDEIRPNYWIYSFLCDDREKQLDHLRKRGVYASSVHLRNDYYSCFGPFDSSLKGVAEFAAKELSVPSGWWVNKEDIRNV